MISLFLLAFLHPALALDVVCTLPWLGSVTSELAPQAHVTVLARGTEDPHYLSPTPKLMATVSRADLFVENGLNLELWSERLLDGAGNPAIRPGRPGYVKASQGVPRLEVPARLTRAEGDLHPEGNPHIWTDPLNVGMAAANIEAGLERVDPGHASDYAARLQSFRREVWARTFGQDLVDFMGGELLERLARAGKLHEFLASKGMEQRLGGWMAAAARLRGMPVVFYHQSWAYFVDRFGLRVVGYVEDRPGVSPSAAHRDALQRDMKAQGAKVVAVTVYYDDHLARVLAESTGARVAIVPGDVGGVPQATGWAELIDTLISRIGG